MKRIVEIDSKNKIDFMGVKEHGFENAKVQPGLAW
jgi:hypothetical protein